MNTFVILKILAALILPPASLAVGVVLWLLLRLVGWRRLAGVTLGLALFQTLILSFPPVTQLLEPARSRRRRASSSPSSQPCCYDAIVVLGGGIAPAAPPYTMEPELTDASDRIWQAARMFQRGRCPRIIVVADRSSSSRAGRRPPRPRRCGASCSTSASPAT